MFSVVMFVVMFVVLDSFQSDALCKLESGVCNFKFLKLEQAFMYYVSFVFFFLCKQSPCNGHGLQDWGSIPLRDFT